MAEADEKSMVNEERVKIFVDELSKAVRCWIIKKNY